MASNKRGPVVNGVVLEVSDRGRSGYLGVSQRFTGAQAVYFAALDPLTIRAGGGDPALWPRGQGGRVSLGYYTDARIPAYLHALAHDNPAAIVALFNNIVVTGGRSLKQLVDQGGALAQNLPAELFLVPTDYADLMRNYPAVRAVGGAATVKVTLDHAMVQWRQLLTDYGVTGESICRALGGTPADQVFVLGLRTLGYEEAKAELAARGLDLDLDGVERICAA